MKVIICGAGRVGLSIAQYLGDEYTITLVDHDAAVLAEANAQLDVQTVLGSASNPQTLQRAGAANANIFVAVTGQDDVNIVASQIAHSLFNISLKIARLRNLSTFDSDAQNNYRSQFLPIDVIISPEKETTQEILYHLRAPFAFSSFAAFQGRVYVLGLTIDHDSPLLPYPIQHLDKILGSVEASFVAIDRQGHTRIPHLQDLFQEGDIAYFTILEEHISLFAKTIGYAHSRVERVLIFGGDRMGLLLASEIERTYPHISCVLIEPQNMRTRHLITQLNNTIVMQGDPLEPSVLQEAGVQFTDSVIAITADDTVNILGTLLAKRYGAKNAVSLISRQSYTPLMQLLKIDKLFNPAFLAIAMILTHVRRDYVTSLRKLGENALDSIMELRVTASALAVGTPLSVINQAEKFWIFSILRNNKVLTGTPSLTLEEGDSVLALCMQAGQEHVRNFFEPATPPP